MCQTCLWYTAIRPPAFIHLDFAKKQTKFESRWTDARHTVSAWQGTIQFLTKSSVIIKTRYYTTEDDKQVVTVPLNYVAERSQGRGCWVSNERTYTGCPIVMFNLDELFDPWEMYSHAQPR